MKSIHVSQLTKQFLYLAFFKNRNFIYGKVNYYLYQKNKSYVDKELASLWCFQWITILKFWSISRKKIHSWVVSSLLNRYFSENLWITAKIMSKQIISRNKSRANNKTTQTIGNRFKAYNEYIHFEVLIIWIDFKFCV